MCGVGGVRGGEPERLKLVIVSRQPACIVQPSYTVQVFMLAEKLHLDTLRFMKLKYVLIKLDRY
jgi:hypothetical protein